jgi:hypothetical protein
MGNPNEDSNEAGPQRRAKRRRVTRVVPWGMRCLVGVPPGATSRETRHSSLRGATQRRLLQNSAVDLLVSDKLKRETCLPRATIKTCPPMM